MQRRGDSSALQDPWIELTKKPVGIGKCSRGFIIDKEVIRLKENKLYFIRIKEVNNYAVESDGNKTNE